MLLHELAKTSRELAHTPGRLDKIAGLSAFLRRLPPHEIEIGVAYLVGRLRQGRIGLGGALVAEALHAPPAPRSTLTLQDVDECFAHIQASTGRGSAAARHELLSALFERATDEECEFLARLVLGELRQGALEGVMVEAIAQAGQVPAAHVRRALMVAGDPASVAKAVLQEGRAGLDRFAMQLLQPVKPMLAQTADSVDQALEQLDTAALEYKLDGARVQVHKADGTVRVFTRRLHDVSAAVPEIVQAVQHLPAHRLILDGEALAFQPGGMPQPFQVTMRRFGRRLDIARMREALPLRAYFFDILHCEGEDLIDRPAVERFEVLASTIPPELAIPRLVTADVGAAARFMEEALRRGHEGLMAKSLQAPYEAGNRGSSWLKLKPAHTLDLVVLAAEWGHGRRQGWLSNLHLGARAPQTGSYLMLGKTFKGMTDQMLAWQTQKLRELEIGRDAYTVYVRPELVVEVAFNDIQASPQYPAGLVLRFARVKRYRPDKRADEADTIEAVRAIYARAQQRGLEAGG